MYDLNDFKIFIMIGGSIIWPKVFRVGYLNISFMVPFFWKKYLIAHTTRVYTLTYSRKTWHIQMNICILKRIANMNDSVNDFPNRSNNEPRFLTTEDLNQDLALVNVSEIMSMSLWQRYTVCVSTFDDRNNNCWQI